MRAIIHKTVLKIKSYKIIISQNLKKVLMYLVFLIFSVFLIVLGMVFGYSISLRDNVEIIYPQLPKNTIIYLPESERQTISNRYIDMSNISYMTGSETGDNGLDATQSFVASKNGSRFYPVDCKSASRIKPENKIYFNTASDAERAGLTLASGCSL